MNACCALASGNFFFAIRVSEERMMPWPFSRADWDVSTIVTLHFALAETDIDIYV